MAHAAPLTLVKGLNFEFGQDGTFVGLSDAIPVFQAFGGDHAPTSGAVNVEVYSLLIEEILPPETPTPTDIPTQTPSIPPTTTPTPTVTPTVAPGQVIVSLLDSWTDTVGLFPAEQPILEFVDDLASWLPSSAEVVSASISSTSDTVYAFMTDGRVEIIHFPQPSFQDEEIVLPVGEAEKIDPKAAKAAWKVLPRLERRIAGQPIIRFPQGMASYGYPGNKKVLLLDSTNYGISDRRQDIKRWFERRGYQATLKSGTVEDFTHLSEYAIVLLRAHGVPYPDAGTGQERFALSTSDRAVPTTPGELIRVWFIRLQFGSVPGMLVVTTDDYYAVTTDFLTKYNGDFPENALFYCDACSSAKTSDLREAVFSKDVSYFLGWTKPVSSGYAAALRNYIFDRSLAANDFMKQQPPSRTYNFAVLYSHLFQQGLLTDPYGKDPQGNPCHAQLAMHTVPAVDHTDLGPLFVPVVQMPASVDPSPGSTGQQFEVEFLGCFGTDEGAVKLDSADLTVAHWTSLQIIANLSQGKSGIMRVVSANGLESDPLPLVRYEGDMTYHYNAGGAPDIKIQVFPKFHVLPFVNYRHWPDESRVPGQVLGGAGFLEASSVCAWAVVGQESDVRGGTISYTGTSSKTYDQSTQDVGFDRSRSGAIITSPGRATVETWIGFEYTVTHVNQDEGIHETWQVPFSTKVEFTRDLDQNYGIPAGQKTSPDALDRLSWKRFSPQPTPSADQPH